jgi:hypothetical protein
MSGKSVGLFSLVGGYIWGTNNSQEDDDDVNDDMEVEVEVEETHSNVIVEKIEENAHNPMKLQVDVTSPVEDHSAPSTLSTNNFNDNIGNNYNNNNKSKSPSTNIEIQGDSDRIIFKGEFIDDMSYKTIQQHLSSLGVNAKGKRDELAQRLKDVVKSGAAPRMEYKSKLRNGTPVRRTPGRVSVESVSVQSTTKSRSTAPPLSSSGKPKGKSRKPTSPIPRSSTGSVGLKYLTIQEGLKSNMGKSSQSEVYDSFSNVSAEGELEDFTYYSPEQYQKEDSVARANVQTKANIKSFNSRIEQVDTSTKSHVSKVQSPPKDDSHSQQTRSESEQSFNHSTSEKGAPVVDDLVGSIGNRFLSMLRGDGPALSDSEYVLFQALLESKRKQNEKNQSLENIISSVVVEQHKTETVSIQSTSNKSPAVHLIKHEHAVNNTGDVPATTDHVLPGTHEKAHLSLTTHQNNVPQSQVSQSSVTSPSSHGHHVNSENDQNLNNVTSNNVNLSSTSKKRIHEVIEIQDEEHDNKSDMKHLQRNGFNNRYVFINVLIFMLLFIC